MRVAGCFFFALGLAVLASPGTAAVDKPIVFRTAVIGATEYTYEVYVPADWSGQKTWPVILFLHGAGERGSYPAGDRASVIARFFVTYQEEIPAVVVFPRCAAGKVWSDPEMEALALKSLEQTIAEWNGDRGRVYLTGLSMGGYGTWFLAGQYPGKFAAIAVVCGGIRGAASFPELALSQAASPYAEFAARVRKLPVWIFHGDADPVIPVEESRQMYAALRELGADVRYSEYPGVQHDSWNHAYADPGVLKWLLSHRMENARRKP